jgi:carbon-monoxide dehydrogenase large subunit
MDAALAVADRPGFAARRKGSERAGRLRGWGIANCLELCGFGYGEQTELVVGADGIIDLLIGTQSSGQGHATVYAQIAADHLGIPAGCVRVVQGDTERIATGSGTGASRSLSVGGSATILAARTLIETGRDMAAEFMEVGARDVVYQDGRYQIAGTDLRMTLAEIAARAPADAPFAARESYTPAGGTFPTGCHVCEVEVDPETGAVAVVRYCLAQDVGKAVNPLIIKGQLDGGVALGIGQALFEHMIYDRETGQLVTGSFIDYAMPRADDFPNFEATLLEVPSTNNPLGARGVGESGALGAPAAVVNALIDALAPLGVRDITMPATPHRVWRAIADAAARQG